MDNETHKARNTTYDSVIKVTVAIMIKRRDYK